MEIFNNDRPHQALNMKYPGELYIPSPRAFYEPEPLESRFMTEPSESPIVEDSVSTTQDQLKQRVRWSGRGIREVSDKIWRASFSWRVNFMEFDLGFFDQYERRVEPERGSPTIKMGPLTS
jgi:putative transposase